MADGIKAGDAFIEVSLKPAPDFFKKFVAENSTSATKAGDDLGDRIGKAIAKRISQGVKDGLGAGGAFASAQGTKTGDDFGGKFADTAKKRIEAALKSLPTPQIGVATTEADQKLRDLRSQLQELSSKRIGVDVGGEEALAEVRRIKTELDELGSKSPNIQVKTDTAAAAAHLAAIQVQIARINGQSPNVNVNTNANQAAGQVSTLVNAIILLGPAAVPAAAAAVAAILGIGTAAVSVFSAIGVAKLAFSGVGAAVKALDGAQQGAAKSGATLGQQQVSLASGADQVKSAEASLANTRASAADSVRRANEQVTVSERNLVDAQLADKRARDALSLAQQDAARQIQDLNTAVDDGALAQRRAAADVTAAQQVLTASNTAGSTATAQQRVDAQLAYDEAVQHAKDLAIQQGRAVQDRDAANKAGIAGSKTVVAAQDQIRQADQKVADSERAVSDARAASAAASRQAAFSIAQAQQQVVSSQRSLGQAFVATGATGGAAMDALNQALGKLSPAGQDFARYLYGLKPRLDELKATAQGGLLPGVQAGINSLLPEFSSLDRFVGSVSTELGSLAKQAGVTFTAPFWHQFFGFIGDQAVPNLDLLYHSAINVAEGGARIIQGFGPVDGLVGGTILSLSQKFLAFSQGLDHNQGFQSFVKYAESEIPHVVSTIEALVSAGGHVLTAYAPIGSVVVSEIRILSQIINAIPVNVVTALAAAFTAYKLSSQLATGASSAFNSAVIPLVNKLASYQSAATGAATTTTGLQKATQAAGGAIAGGGFTAALTGATLIVGLFVAKQQEARANIEALKGALGQYGEALKSGVTAESANSAEAILKQNSALRGLVNTTTAAGISTDALVAGLNGDKDARGQIVGALQAQIDAEQKAEKAAQGVGGADNVASLAHHKRADELINMRKAFAQTNTAQAEAADLTKQLTVTEDGAIAALTKVNDTLHRAAASTDDYKSAISAVGSVSADATAKAGALAAISSSVADSQSSATDKATLFGEILNGIGDSATATGGTFDALSTTFDNIARSSLGAHDKVNLLKQALQQAYGPAQDLNASQESLITSQTNLKTQLDQNKVGFDLDSAAKGKNSAAIVQNRQALEQALTAANNTYIQEVANGTAEDFARGKHDATIKSITEGLPTRGKEATAVKGLVDLYGQIPTQKATDVSTPGLADAIDKLAQAHAIDFGLSQKPPWSQDQINNEYQYLKAKISGAPSAALRHAEGGPISGPGTSTSDSIPAMLSDGEFVQRTAAVDYYGVGLMHALNQRAIPRDTLPGFAAGGSVSWPVGIDMSALDKSATTDLAKLKAELVALSTAAAFSPGAANAVGTPGLGSDAIKAFIRSTDPLPYIWAAAGPGGYDCSGIASAVYGLMTGRGGGHGQRYFTTFNFANGAPAPFKPGVGGTFNVGVNPTTHMAGNYGGLGFEAKSTAKGIVVGPGVTPVGAFQKQFHMADGGLVSADLLAKFGLDIGGDQAGMTVNNKKVPYGLFDDGGWLPPDLSVADNRTGSPEAVLNTSQWDAVMTLAARGQSAPDVRVYIGNEEITRHVSVVVDHKMDAVASAISSGVRDY